MLSFDDIAYRRPVGVYYEVYVNKPADTPPDFSSPYYVGILRCLHSVMAATEYLVGKLC